MKWLESYATELGFGAAGIFVLTFLLKKLRLWIVSLRKKPEAQPTTTTPAASDPTEEKPALGGPEIPPKFQYSTAPAAAAEPVNPVEAYYAAHRRNLAVCEKEIGLVVQKAQFEAVERNNPQLVTVYDPADVTVGLPIAKAEDFPLDDLRRKADSGHPAAGMTEEVVVIDYRPLPNELVPGFQPLPFREKYKLKAQQRAEAIRKAAIKTARPDGPGGIGVKVTSADPVTQADIEAHKEYSERVRSQARRDFDELKPQIKTDAEKMALEKFVPPRMEEFKEEAAERGVDVQQVIDEFVRKVGEDAVWAAEARFQNPGPLDESNPLLRNLTPERMRKSGAWQY